nr:protein kaku4 [Ipomoea batatas]
MEWTSISLPDVLLPVIIFTRIECDRLINLINSRVVDPPTLDYGLGDAIAVGTTGTSDPCSRYVMEAREWLEDKKDDLRSMACFAEGNCGSSSFLTENVEKVDGSPIYVAKSYMKARPPWASPTEHLDIRTSSSKKSKLFEEGTPFHAGDEFVPSSRKRSSLSSGPWNISEEIRRVRSKATDDILRSLPSKKIDLPLLTERKMKQNAVIDSRDSGSLAHLSISSRPALGTGIGQSVTRQDAGKAVTVTLNSPALIPQDNDRIEVVGEWPATEPHQPNGPVLASENLDAHEAFGLSLVNVGVQKAYEIIFILSNATSCRDGGGEPRPMEIDACSGHERSSDGVHMQLLSLLWIVSSPFSSTEISSAGVVSFRLISPPALSSTFGSLGVVCGIVSALCVWPLSWRFSGTEMASASPSSVMVSTGSMGGSSRTDDNEEQSSMDLRSSNSS